MNSSDKAHGCADGTCELSTEVLISEPVCRHEVTRTHARYLYYKTSQLMLYSEIIAVCSEIHTKHINTLCGQNVELLNVKLAVHIVTTGL